MRLPVLRSLCVAAIVAIISSQSASAQVKPPDWRLYGFFNFDGRDVELFYLASGLRRNGDGNIEVWTKGLPMREVTNAKPDKAHAEDAARKLLSGYLPPVARTQKVPQPVLMSLIAAEETANSGDVDPVTRVMWEL